MDGTAYQAVTVRMPVPPTWPVLVGFPFGAVTLTVVPVLTVTFDGGW
jgi:hypothetical protein